MPSIDLVPSTVDTLDVVWVPGGTSVTVDIFFTLLAPPSLTTSGFTTLPISTSVPTQPNHLYWELDGATLWTLTFSIAQSISGAGGPFTDVQTIGSGTIATGTDGITLAPSYTFAVPVMALADYVVRLRGVITYSLLADPANVARIFVPTTTGSFEYGSTSKRSLILQA